MPMRIAATEGRSRAASDAARVAVARAPIGPSPIPATSPGARPPVLESGLARSKAATAAGRRRAGGRLLHPKPRAIRGLRVRRADLLYGQRSPRAIQTRVA